MLTLSKERKMGVIFTECGSRLKWFQIDKAASMVQMEEKMKSIIVTDEDLFNGAWAKVCGHYCSSLMLQACFILYVDYRILTCFSFLCFLSLVIS